MVTSHSNTQPVLGTLPTSELIRQALDETKELVRLEVKLAREEVRDDVLQLKQVAIFGGIALVAAIVGLSTLVTALVLAVGGTALAALIVGGVLLVLTAVLAAVAYARLPKVPLGRTRARIESDIVEIKEHLA